MSFAAKISEGFARGKRLSVGIDPHDSLLDAAGLSQNASGAELFGRKVLESVAGSQTLCIKPQVAFFERFGAKGYIALERILKDARDAGIVVIADVKRGDIGSTFDAYADAWLAPDSPLEADAMTVHPYQGFDSIQPALKLARRHGKGVFVLAATSNPEAQYIQKSRNADGVSVAAQILHRAQKENEQNISGLNDASLTVGEVGVVLGATLNLAEYGIAVAEETLNTITPVLAPGFGAQGASLDDASEIFGGLSKGLIVHESRGLFQNGIENLRQSIEAKCETIGNQL